MSFEFTAYHNVIVHSLRNVKWDRDQKLASYSSRIRSVLDLIYIHRRGVAVLSHTCMCVNVCMCVHMHTPIVQPQSVFLRDRLNVHLLALWSTILRLQLSSSVDLETNMPLDNPNARIQNVRPCISDVNVRGNDRKLPGRSLFHVRLLSTPATPLSTQSWERHTERERERESEGEKAVGTYNDAVCVLWKRLANSGASTRKEKGGNGRLNERNLSELPEVVV